MTAYLKMLKENWEWLKRAGRLLHPKTEFCPRCSLMRCEASGMDCCDFARGDKVTKGN